MQAKLRGFFSADFLSDFIRLAWPIVLQQLVSASLFLVDNLMIGSLGEAELAAVSQANQLSNIMFTFLYGISAGASIFCAQFWGARNRRGIHEVLTLTLILMAAMGLLGGSVALLFPRQFISLYSSDAAVVEHAVTYLRTIFPTYLFLGFTHAFSAVNKSTERVRLPMLASILSLCTNTFLNYCLIFGNLGFPQLGVRGGAIASLIASVMECTVLVAFTFILKYPAAPLGGLVWPKLSFIKRFFRTSLPVVANDGIWGLGSTTLYMVYGTLGTAAVAAVSIAGTLDRLIYVTIIGIVHAASIMIGRSIGSGNEGQAYDHAKKSMVMAFGIGAVSSVLLLLIASPVVSLFNVPEQTAATARWLITVIAIVLPVRATGYTSVVGVLRSGGDTAYAAVLESLSMWAGSVLCVSLAGLVLHLPIEIVYIFAYAEDIPKLTFGLRRFVTRKWIKNLVKA